MKIGSPTITGVERRDPKNPFRQSYVACYIHHYGSEIVGYEVYDALIVDDWVFAPAEKLDNHQKGILSEELTKALAIARDKEIEFNNDDSEPNPPSAA